MTKKERFQVYRYLLQQLKHHGNKYQRYHGFCLLLVYFRNDATIKTFKNIKDLTELYAFKPKSNYCQRFATGRYNYTGYWYSQSKIGNNKRIQILESILKNNKQ